MAADPCQVLMPDTCIGVRLTAHAAEVMHEVTMTSLNHEELVLSLIMGTIPVPWIERPGSARLYISPRVMMRKA
jgi:hypothetical protein